MSKESRRAARLARESRRLGGASGASGAKAASGGATSHGAADGLEPGPSAAASATSGSGATTTRSTRPPGTPTRAGRRTRVRHAPKASFFERYRSAILTVTAVAVVAIAAGFVFISSTAASYTCGQQFDPSPTPTLDPSSSARLGFAQDDMGRLHDVVLPEHYIFCPPASGSHFNNPGVSGPIRAAVYKPDDRVGPPNWIHNLEHGALVVLYRNDSTGATAAGQQAFRDYFATFPPSPTCKVPPGQLAPVIARFDTMPHPFAALVWDRVFYMDTWDPALATKFYLTESERLDSTGVLNRVNPPEPQCAGPSAIPTVAPSESAPAASGSAAPASAAPSAATSAAPSASPEPSAAPS